MRGRVTPSVNRGCPEQEVSTQRDNFEQQCLTFAITSVILLVLRAAEWSVPLKILFSVAGELVWIQSSTLTPRTETFAEELCWFGWRMSCHIRCFSEKSGTLTASSKGGNFLSRQNEQAGLLLITKSVVYLTVFFCVLKALAGGRAAWLYCQQHTVALGLISDFLQLQMLTALIFHNAWDTTTGMQDRVF